MEAMSRSKSRIACFVIPVVLAACRFELPEAGTGSEQVEIDAPVGLSCGDAVHDQGEACDTGGDTETCDGDCTAPECGDGYLNPAFDAPGVDEWEKCDKGLANSDTKPDGCRTNCRKAYCGDGVKDKNEECDRDSGCASPSELCGPGCECKPGIPPPRLHGGAAP